MYPEFEKFRDRLYADLILAGLDPEPFTYGYKECPDISEAQCRIDHPYMDDFLPAYGYYINFLLTKSVILAPVFGSEKDKEAIAALKKWYPKHSVVALDCAELSMEGGCMSCVSWNVIEE
jgi:agmatine/peptidylarginine deiminase